jgi:hypothetical protein
MRKLLVSILLTLSFALGGCQGVSWTAHNPATLTTPAQKVQGAIDDAKIGLLAVVKTLDQDYTDGVYTREETIAYLDRIEKARDSIKEAERYVGLGDLTTAESRVTLARAVISTLRTELIKQKNKGN